MVHCIVLFLTLSLALSSPPCFLGNPGGRKWDRGAFPWWWRRGEWTGVHDGLLEWCCHWHWRQRFFYFCQEGAACVRTRGELTVKRIGGASAGCAVVVVAAVVVQGCSCDTKASQLLCSRL